MAELVAPDDKMQNMESEDFNITEDILNNFSETTFNQLPQKSRERYVNEKEKFLDWMKSKDISVVTEEVVVAYFKVLMEKYAPSSLWATYSMLRSTLLLFEKVDISKYKTLCPILKNNSKGYQPKKAKTFELRHLEKFLNEAPDKVFLLMKVALVMGIMGACRCDELVYLKTTDIQDKGNVVIVNIHKTKNYKARSFVLTDLEGRGFSCLEIYRRYATLRRLSSCGEGRFFLGYRNGKCSIQPVGVNMISKVPKLVANYLNLKDAHLYTGHCFRRTSAILFANSSADILILKQRGLDWSTTAAEESCVEQSIVNKMKMARSICDLEGATSNKRVCVQSERLDSSMDLNLTDQFLVNTLGINNAVFNNGGEKFYVALIMGVMGACRSNELYEMKITHLQDLGSAFLVNVPNTKTKICRKFTVTNNFYEICKRYINLRPSDVISNTFFLNYQNGKCTTQRIGINKFTKMGKDIAAFLKLPNPEQYSGHSFRRSSATIRDDAGGDITALIRHGGWKSTAIAEGYIEESGKNETNMADTISSSIELKGEMPKIENETDDSDSKIEVNDTYVTPEYVELNTNSNEMSMEETESNSLLGNPLRMNDKTDEFQVFGDFVASELRNLRSRENQNKLKRMIQRAILEISEIDDDGNF